MSKFRKTLNEELGRISIEEFKSQGKLPVVVMLDNVRSMNNVGSAFRTSDAFGIEKIILTGITAQPPHRDIQKTALGATESVDWEYEEDPLKALEALKENGWTIVGIEQVEPNTQLQDFKTEGSKKYCLIFGNEVSGISDEVIEYCDHCIEIPQVGTKHSLNISVSIGVVLWTFFDQLREA